MEPGKDEQKGEVTLRRTVDDDIKEPAFLAIITASGGAAYKRDAGICVIPIDLLDP